MLRQIVFLKLIAFRVSVITIKIYTRLNFKIHYNTIHIIKCKNAVWKTIKRDWFER